jgi:putative FmdB family regulatory protein
MPIYEYQCQKCAHHLEALQKISDKPLRECPECGRHTLKRLMSAPMFRLAGSGWYETDFKSDKEQKRNLAESGETEAPKGDAKPEVKADAKPESKTESQTASKTESGPEAKSESSSVAKPRATVTKPAIKTRVRQKAAPQARKSRTPRARKR